MLKTPASRSTVTTIALTITPARRSFSRRERFFIRQGSPYALSTSWKRPVASPLPSVQDVSKSPIARNRRHLPIAPRLGEKPVAVIGRFLPGRQGRVRRIPFPLGSRHVVGVVAKQDVRLLGAPRLRWM